MNSRLNKSSQKKDSEATVRLPTSHFTSTAQRYSLDRSTRLRESILSKCYRICEMVGQISPPRRLKLPPYEAEHRCFFCKTRMRSRDAS